MTSSHSKSNSHKSNHKQQGRIIGRPFTKGYDARRHQFTRAECQAGFWSALEAIILRYPDAIMPDGRHMAVNFLTSLTRQRAQKGY